MSLRGTNEHPKTARQGSTSPSSIRKDIELEIAQAERLFSEYVCATIVARRKGADTTHAKGHINDMRKMLEKLYARRRSVVRLSGTRSVRTN
jgi:hypothetical protein